MLVAGFRPMRDGMGMQGVVYDARMAISGTSAAPAAAALLSRPREHRAIVRFSRAVGLPRPIPDLLGLSLRIPDAYGENLHQDFLLVTSADLPLVHHIFLPALDVQQRPYTSALPYRAGGDLLLVGAVPRGDSPRPGGSDEFDRLHAAAATGRLVFDIAVARIAGRFRRVGSLHVAGRLRPELDALRFNPWNSGGGMEPAGWLNGARDRAYQLPGRLAAHPSGWAAAAGRRRRRAQAPRAPRARPLRRAWRGRPHTLGTETCRSGATWKRARAGPRASRRAPGRAARPAGAAARKRGIDLALGIGLEAGYATLGRIGFEARFDYGALGPATNLAARLCSHASPGQTLIGQRVFAATEEAVETAPVGSLELKGFGRPVVAYEVCRLR